MTTEQTTETTTQEPTPEPTPAEDKQKMMPVSAHMTQQAELKAQLEATEAKIAAYEKAQSEAEQKKLEEQGEWKTLAENAKNEADQAKAAAAAEIRKYQLEAKLAGARDEITLQGLMAACPADVEPADYRAQVEKEHPEYFTAPGLQPADQSRQLGGSSAGGSSSDGWGQVQKDYDSGIPDKVNAATIKVLKYQAEHEGKKPPGNW